MAIPVSQCNGKHDICPGDLTVSIGQILAVKATLWGFSFLINFDTIIWDDKLVGGMDFVAEYVLQVPFFLMSLLRYITPTLDHMYAGESCLFFFKASHNGLIEIKTGSWTP